MSPTQLIIIGAVISLITSAYFYENYQEKRLEYETKKLERTHSSEEKLELIRSNNQLAMAAVESPASRAWHTDSQKRYHAVGK